MKKQTSPIQTMLTISVGFSVIYLVTKQTWAIWVSVIIGVIGMFSPYLSAQIDFLWAKLTWVLSLIVPKILLSTVFYLFLFPIATLSKWFGNKDNLYLKNPPKSTFKDINKTFDKNSFEKPW